MGGPGSGRKKGKDKRMRVPPCPALPDPPRGDDSPVGRPNICTPEVTRLICEHVARGLYLETAAPLVGISAKVVRRWLYEGQQEYAKPEYVEFVAAYKRADSQAQAYLIDGIRHAGGKAWTALAWIAERRWPHLYGRWERPKDDPEVTASGTLSELAKAMDLNRLSPQELTILLAIIRKLEGDTSEASSGQDGQDGPDGD